MAKVAASALLLMLVMLLAGCASHQPAGPNWSRMEGIQPTQKAVEIQVEARTRLKLGDHMRFKVHSSKSGRLWIFEIDPADRLTMIYPNELAQDNHITANRAVALPEVGSGWEVVASEPTGKSLLVFIVTTGKTELSQVLDQPFTKTKAINLANSGPTWGVYRVVIEVRKGG